ncbi:ATP-dependent helicase HrpB [Sediminihabitans luteus]|uniref:ATP-dependent helicase HrpB n=1 Tax=Sediminihabitans luteus TaxID=1138585 RepID=A0A2M9CQF7_9CELL|nr:ATP-dependent helicase HrpB [Sediminihabitans luteus]PJJ74127.1 ATP-dependent helicase HrpB [Sediminihabitans luteus]
MPADPIARLLAAPPDLPVRAHLDDVVRAVVGTGRHTSTQHAGTQHTSSQHDSTQPARAAVVQAPPGTGKTTLVPPALAHALPGTILVTQPRRIAARAAARRLARLLGEEVGRTAGYVVRDDVRTSPATRVEFVTTGILLRRLQADPDLPGVGAVVLDEVHERHLDDDLALALLVDVRTNLRDDLAVVAMSATVEAERTARVLGGPGAPASVVEVEGSLFDVDVVWAPPRGPWADERGVTHAYLDHVAACVRRALAERTGDVLVFVPGVREVDEVARRLAGVDADVRRLHGRLAPREQDLALTAGPRRRVVVSTAVAESSLTVPGVRVVVDAGLSREPRTDLRRGLPGLVTVRVSRAAAEQRAGRAGREGPGAVYRCWSPGDHARLAAHPEPEIRTADLTALMLDLAAWGSPGGEGLALLDPPPVAAAAVATQTLRGLGAVDDDGAVTPAGRRIAAVPTDPRLARALLDSAGTLGSRRSAEIVALLSQDVRPPGADLVAGLRALRRGGPGADAWARQARRLRAVLDGRPDRPGDRAGAGEDDRLPDDLAVGLVAALAHPARVARLRPGGSAYLTVGGTGAMLPPGSGLAGAPWLAIADADLAPGRRDAVVRAAAPVDLDLATTAAAHALTEEDVVAWAGGRVQAHRVRRLGAIELARAPLTHPPAEQVTRAVRAGLAADGLDALRWSDVATHLRERLRFLHGALGEPWPDVSDDELLGRLDDWLDVSRVRGAGDLARLDVLSGLRGLLPWPQAARLDELAPERLAVPSGSTVRVDYAGEQPVLAVRLQEVFGWTGTPRLADGRVPVLLHLLSPARRPAAVTADLESFWRTGYPQVRAELRGRYPKHSWPEDPLSAEPTRGVRRPGR